MKLLIKFPTRERPVKFQETLKIWRDNLSREHDVKFLVTIDEDDVTMNNDTIRRAMSKFSDVKLVVGPNKSKIQAVNYGMEGEDFDVLILASDDMVPQLKGYDDVIMEDMQTYYPAMDGALHYNDGFRGSGLCTLSIMGKRLYDWFGYIYHPEYSSLWCDNEFTEVTTQLGKRTYLPNVVVKHEHYINTGKKNPDKLQERNDSLNNVDRKVYETRRQQSFGLERPKLSVLIPTLVCRKEKRERLVAALEKQITKNGLRKEVEYHLLLDNKELTVGEKRNALLDKARGEYLCYFDDDDLPAEDYLTSLLTAIKENPGIDCVAFNGMMTTDGKDPREFKFSIGYGYSHTKGDTYYRTPNHLCPIRADIAKARRFPAISFGEDSRWADELLRAGLLKKEVVIDKVLYYYLFEKEGTATQTLEIKRKVRNFVPSVIYLKLAEDVTTRKDGPVGPMVLKKGEIVMKVRKQGDHVLVRDKQNRKHVLRQRQVTPTMYVEENTDEATDKPGVLVAPPGKDDSAGGSGRERQDNTTEAAEAVPGVEGAAGDSSKEPGRDEAGGPDKGNSAGQEKHHELAGRDTTVHGSKSPTPTGGSKRSGLAKARGIK